MDDGETTQEENQRENNGREQECENGNPAKAFNRSNMATSTGRGDCFSSRILDRPRTKEKETSHRQCKRQPRHSLFPPVTCLVRLCTRRVQDPLFKSLNGCFRKTGPSSVFTTLKIASYLHFLPLGENFFKVIIALMLSQNVFPLKGGAANWMSYSS